MFYAWRRKLRTWSFDQRIRSVMETPPIAVVDAPWTIVSMIKPRDVPMYILAMKSLYRHLRRGKLIAIVDRAAPHDQREILRHHFRGIEFLVLEDIDPGRCQKGGTWERLVFLLDRSEREYVMQVDADTLSFGTDLNEIVRCIEGNVAFTMADDGRLGSMRVAAEESKVNDSDYIGIVAERLFDRYPNCDSLRYVRGSSGFAGFAKGGFSRQQIEEFHQIMERLTGPRWREWGTEQCGSNFAVANSPGAVVLPFPAYSSHVGQVPDPATKFYHFIGSNRFDNGLFARLGRDVIAQLGAGPTQPAERPPTPAHAAR